MIDSRVSVQLGDVTEIQTGFPFKSSEYSDDPADPKLLRGDNIAQGRVRWDGVKRWPLSRTAEVAQYWLREGDIILAMDRPWIEAGLKYCAIQPDDLPCLLVQRVARLRGANGLDNGFLRYLIGSQSFTDHVLAIQTGTAVPHISSKQIQSFRFELPPLPEQRVIAATLGALDDKIELNRKMNATLEAMARALFRDWFVDFGPTRAKMEGAAPYLSPDLWPLFPDRLDSEGKPEGWEAGTMSDLFTLQRGFDLPSQDRRDGKYPILAASGQSGFHETHMVKGPGVTTGRSGVLGRVFYVHSDFWPLNTSLWVKDYKQATPHYAYQFLSLIDLAGFNAGSAVPTLNRNHVHGLPAVLPPRELVTAFDQFADGLMSRHRHNEVENETLAQTRDLLLPRLMSGELRVAELEGTLETVP